MSWKVIAPSASFLGVTDPVAIRDASAAQDVFIGQQGGVFYVAGSPLGSWPDFSGNVGDLMGDATKIAVAHESDQRLVLFVADQNEGAVWQTSQGQAGSLYPPKAGTDFVDWRTIGGALGTQDPQLGQPAAGYASNGGLSVFVAVSDPNSATNSLFCSTETAANTGQWSGWHNLGGGADPAYRPAVVTDALGKLHVFLPGGTHTVQYISQTSPGGNWSAWKNLGTPGPGTGNNVAAATDTALAGNRSGCLEVLVVGSNSHLYQIAEVTPGGAWSAWTDLGGVGQPMRLAGYTNQPLASPSIGANGNGTLEAYVAAQDNNIYRISQESPGGPWANWTSLGSPGAALASNPAVGKIVHNDLLQLFVLCADGKLYNLSQRRNSTW